MIYKYDKVLNTIYADYTNFIFTLIRVIHVICILYCFQSHCYRIFVRIQMFVCRHLFNGRADILHTLRTDFLKRNLRIKLSRLTPL